MPKGGEISVGDIAVRQPDNATAPATARIIYATDELTLPSATGQRVAALELSTGVPSVTDTTAIETAKVETEARKPLLWIGSGCIVAGLLVATLFKYPTPGGLLALTGASLIGMHEYPWLGMVACGLGAAAVAIVIGFEVAERRAKTSTATQ